MDPEMAVADDPAEWPEFVHDDDLAAALAAQIDPTRRGTGAGYIEAQARIERLTGIPPGWIAGAGEGFIPSHHARLIERRHLWERPA